MMRRQTYFCTACGCHGSVTYRSGAGPAAVAALAVADHNAREPACKTQTKLRVLVDRRESLPQAVSL